jgi:von Willebrand factor type C domain
MTRCSAFGLVAWFASALCLAGCGGTFKSGDGNEGGGTSGGTGSGGTGSGGASGRKSCVVGGKTYADGDTFESDCNGCSCNDGQVACTTLACADGCDLGGKHYSEGETFPSSDGCNSCSCVAGGIACTTRACIEPNCEGVAATYAAAVDKARQCDPKAMGQCRGKLAEGLQCACGVFVNQVNTEAIAAAKQAAANYSAANCGGDVLCGACATAVDGYCSAAGVCETLWEEGPTACKVNGVVYPDGATDIPDPTSCNKCSCKSGQLSCTEINCPMPCPPDRVFSTQCALCGPTDGCLVVEHACLPTCSPNTDSCVAGACSDGVCRSICG